MFSAQDSALLTRRRFLSWSQAALAALGASSILPSKSNALSTTSEAQSADDYYAKLGVEKIINAAGTYTYLTAAVMPPQVQRAVAQAALHPVVLKDLQIASGEYIAKRLRCEAALVSSGASAALTLATAACLANANGIAANLIPESVGSMKNEVIVQKAHRYEYDHAMLLCGVRIVEVTTLDEYRRAFSPKTIMTNFFNSAEGGETDRQTWLEVAHQHNVPCHMDAAADMPPIENLWKYTGMGYDLVCFSGGKGIRGPQNAGLLLGKKHLIDLAMESNNPNSDAVGRGMKVAKEQIVGMVAAVDWLLDQNDEADQAEYKRRADLIIREVKSIPTMKTEIFVPEIANHVPHLMLSYDPQVVGITPKQVQERLRAQRPRIELNPATGSSGRFGSHSNENTIVVGTWMLQPGEAEIVGRQLRAVLSSHNT
ncbi:aminotransferase class V-fold PLP-dependent enzyme [Tunturiibacter gelidoferens]|uniref:L-seryl-tRNA(Ser) seleniumtransferase n=1 Tax=Tunturiibacter gelidiferens TaxID=3069689 RepID=A0A9X0QFX0_9BACT|nr:aminotransferase class V-fold PLP-dependent enzyme [Edaphobacter lichenicola]MBB5329505.1 L-seryl-tRNA(Ser) seleniumtransferase [Edaphobacter lichenicola]